MAQKKTKVEAKKVAVEKKASKANLYIIIFFVFLIVGMVAAKMTLGSNTVTGPSGSNAKPVGIAKLGNPTLVGNKSAVTTVDLWEDFQCPICGTFEQSPVRPVLDKAVAAGKIKLAYHMLSFLDQGVVNGPSERAANASLCAADQGKFTEFHKWAYAHQPAEGSNGYSNDTLIGYAGNIGISNVATYTACVTSNKYSGQVTTVANSMNTHKPKVTGTPTVFINGKVVPQTSVFTADYYTKALGL
jgi:protein-disulfide isomerase